jgi:hypothetical protein
MKTGHLLIVVAAALVAGILFWPTLYRYDKLKAGDNTYPVRINRVTGHTELFIGSAWVPEKGRSRTTKGKPLPPEELSNLTGDAQLISGHFQGKVYNGSAWVVTRIVFGVVAKEKDGRIRWGRALSDAFNLEPLSTGSFYISVTGEEEIGSFEWQIMEAEGHQP